MYRRCAIEMLCRRFPKWRTWNKSTFQIGGASQCELTCFRNNSACGIRSGNVLDNIFDTPIIRRTVAHFLSRLIQRCCGHRGSVTAGQSCSFTRNIVVVPAFTAAVIVLDEFTSRPSTMSTRSSIIEPWAPCSSLSSIDFCDQFIKSFKFNWFSWFVICNCNM